MKIGHTAEQYNAVPVSGGHKAATENGKAAAVSSTAIPAEAESSAKIALSSTAAEMLEKSRSDFDAEKVAKMQQAIADGTFKMNPEVIADKLIGNAREILTKVQ